MPPRVWDGRGSEWSVRPRQANIQSVFRDLWEYRTLFPFIFRQSILQVYRKAWLGAAWLFIRPAIAVVIAVLVVGQVLGINTDPIPLLLFTVTGFALWIVFQRGLRHGTKSLTRGSGLIRRVNVPRLILVLCAVGPTLIEFLAVAVGALAIGLFFAISGIFVPAIGWQALAAIPVFILAIFLAWGISCFTSVLSMIALDIYLTMNYLVGALFVLTPVAYPLSAVPEAWRWIIELNPLTPLMETWRWALLGTHPPEWWSLAYSVLVIAAVDLLGLAFFMYYERVALDRT